MIALFLILLISLIQINYVHSDCKSIKPSKPEVCWTAHSKYLACCYTTLYYQTNNPVVISCKEFSPATARNGIFQSDASLTYSDCGNYFQQYPQDTTASCGITYPRINEDCFRASTVVSNCCILIERTPGQTKQSCFYSGSKNSQNYMNVVGTTEYQVICQGKHLIMNLFFIALILVIIFF
jgi:hypothetical protein